MNREDLASASRSGALRLAARHRVAEDRLPVRRRGPPHGRTAFFNRRLVTTFYGFPNCC